MAWWPWTGGATEESDTERDGFLSYSAEIHALVNGYANGLGPGGPTKTANDSKREPQYFNYGYASGWWSKLIGIVLAIVIVATVIL